jgi:hypothetical protein
MNRNMPNPTTTSPKIIDVLVNNPIFYDNKPKEPAVTPTAKKKLNSTKSLVPGGIAFIIVDINIMTLHIALR